MSVPITLRAVIRRWQSMKVKLEPPNPDFSVAVGGSNMGMDFQQLKDRSCGAESSDRRNMSNTQNVVLPPGIMNFNNSNPTSNMGGLPSGHKSSSTGLGPQPSSSYSISPVGGYPQPPQSPMDILNYMNPFLNLGNQLGPQSFPNVAMQMLAASQMAGQASSSTMLMGLLDQVGQTQKRRKRKNTTDNSIPPVQQSGQQPQLANRPAQSPSRSNSVNLKSPMQSRRQSDSSESSVGTVNEKNMFNMLMSEFGMDNLPDSRWNIDITPVTTSADITDDVESLKKHGSKKATPKRSMSLDSHSSEDIASIQNLIDSGASVQDFKPLMTPSLSITPVSQTTTSNVNSLLASIRPGIEIIPLNQPVSIPSSITVTPIMGKSVGGTTASGGAPADKLESKQKKKDRTGGGGSATKRRMDEGGESKPPKIPFLDSKGRMSPSINLTKKPSSPSMNSPNSKPMASGGKPSVSTLKSVSSSSSSTSTGSPKYNVDSKQKIKKPNLKAIKNLSNMTIPQLKAISPDLTSIPINRPDSAPSPSKPQGGGLDGTNSKSQDPAKLVNQSQIASAAVTAALQQAAASLVAANQQQKPPIAKKGGLAAVIDKLKSVHSSTEPAVPDCGKKESQTTMSNTDYLKVSSAITNDVLQQKKALGGTTVAGPVGPAVGGSNQEYMIKGGQGLKLTINKTKFKDPTKSPKPGIPGIMKSPSGLKKIVPGMKPLSALSAKLASVTKKSSLSLTSKDLKDQLSKISNIQSKLSKDGSGNSSNKRLESEDLTKKLFLPGAVKSLEMGAFSSAPVFDPNRFQIPKKSKSSSSNSPSVSSSSGGVSSSKTNSGDPSNMNRTKKEVSSVEPKEKITPSTTPTPMEVDPPELVPETSSTTSSSSVTHRSEPPPLIEVGSSTSSAASSFMSRGSNFTATATAAGTAPPVVAPESNSEPDSTTTGAVASQDSKEPAALRKVSDVTMPEGIESPSENQSISAGSASNLFQTANIADFASPESPDPLNFVMNASTPQNIPTTPVNQAMVSDDSPKVASQQAPPAVSLSTTTNAQAATVAVENIASTPLSTQSGPSAPSAATVSSAESVQKRAVVPPPVTPAPEEVDDDQLIIDDGSQPISSSTGPSKEANAKSTSGDTAVGESSEATSSNSAAAGSGTKILEEKPKDSEMPPPPPPQVELTNIAQVTSPAPALLPPSPKPLTSPLAVIGVPTVSIASVHIVHSPQPNSPALLRSPLVQASPAASPYAIDDDLMDEALIGASSK
jgi:hypothetical protein